MKPLHQLEFENEELRRAGLDLYERAEKWRKALEEIAKHNRCPVVASIIKQNIND
jgi:hypothetical protein